MTYLHTSRCIHFHFADCYKLVLRLADDLNEQVSPSGVGGAPHSPSSGWENTGVVVTHLMCQLVWARGVGGQCVCQADNEVVQTFCSGASCTKYNFANVMIIRVSLNCLIDTLLR